MEKAVVTLLIRSFRGGQAAIAHYLYVLSCYIIAVTGGGCFERTEISFIPFRWWIQESVAITYPFENQSYSPRQIHRWCPRCSLYGNFSQEKKAQNQIYLNTKRDRLHDVSGLCLVRPAWAITWRWKSAMRLVVGSISRRQGCSPWGEIWRKPDWGMKSSRWAKFRTDGQKSHIRL